MNAWMHVAGWVLVHFVWQGAVLAIVAALILRLCRRHAASLRYVMACGAMGVMLLGVIVTAALIEAPDANVQATRASVRTTADRRVDVFLPIQMNEAPSRATVSNAARVEMLLPWIVSAWLFGVIVLLARAGAGWWRVRRLHQLALASICSNWQGVGDRIASRLGLASVIRIVELPHVDVPLVVGCLRPIVVLPIAAMAQLNAAQVEAILAHEIAHVRRHDYLVNLMQTLAETLLFYHPAVWWLSGRIRDEREHCCDDVALELCGDPIGYAAALTELESWRSGEFGLAAAATDGSLLNRVRRILHVEVSDDSRGASWTIALLVAAIATALTLNVAAQTAAPGEPNPKFEVASVRENTSGDNKMFMQRLPGGRINAVNMPLGILLRDTYRLQDFQIVGAPDWISSARYDITAKAEGEIPPPAPGDAGFNPVHLMMRSLLEERFKLAVHRETRELPIYALVLTSKNGKMGPELKVSTADCAAIAASRQGPSAPPPPKPGERPTCGIRLGFGEIAGSGFALSAFANAIAPTVQRIVVDRSGLSGNYDWYLKWTPERLPQRAPGTPADQPFRMNGVEIDPNGPSIFTAIQEQLGLKLDSTRGPVEVLVIDHIERPTPD
jgi:bla regulator protein blaR1